MAASIAAAGVGKLVEIMSQPLANEASLLFNFREDFQWVTRKLNGMKAYLEDADQKSSQSNAVKQWLGDLRDVVFDAEDILDECAAKSVSCAVSCSGLVFKHKIARRIRDLKARMNSIDEDARRLQLILSVVATEQASTSSSRADQRKKSSLLEINARPVAIDAKVDEIIRLLDDASHHVIAVVGMGGVGKTFLLQNVYKDPRTKSMFDKCIWLSISQTYSLQKLQSDIAFSLDLRDVVAGHLSEQSAAELIHDSLNKKKFLIVLDDVWRVTEQNNLIQRLGIPVVDTQCKIVTTTRSTDVCTRMNAFQYPMEVLTKEDSWDLFCSYAFYPDNRPPQHLKEIARQVEGKCGKLPLAVKTVAASMANQTRTEQWESKLQKLKEVKKPKDPIMEILQSSYDFLPAHIKPCFLYFAFFGEDERINVKYLINLWRAEGFVPEGNDWKETAFDWYHQLCNLCLVEGEEDKYLNRYCKIHDLVRDLAIHICSENKCGFTLEERCTRYFSSCTQSLSQPDKNNGCRRILLAKQGIKDDQISGGTLLFPTFLRTLSLQQNHVKNLPANIFSKVKALRVLDLSGTPISTLPSSIGCLKLLRVLNLYNTRIAEVPQCIRSLKNLRVLIIYGLDGAKDRVPDWVEEWKCLRKCLRTLKIYEPASAGSLVENDSIPKWVEEWKCLRKCLRTLKVYETGRIVRVPDWIGELKCLEVLRIEARYVPKTMSKLLSLQLLDLEFTKLSVKDNGLLRLEDVGNLIGLQELQFYIHSEADIRKIGGGALERLVNMRKLSMWNCIPTAEDTDDVPGFPEKLTSMKNLEYLWLQGFVVPSSSWMCEFVNLTVLQLWHCECSEYPVVESLPNLITLELSGNRKCREVRKWFGKCGAFPKLRFLFIYDFSLLEELVVLEGGSMPYLEEFELRRCPKVGRVEGLEQLKSLKVFDFAFSGTDECRERLKEGGEEWEKIKASNPRVHILISLMSLNRR